MNLKTKIKYFILIIFSILVFVIPWNGDYFFAKIMADSEQTVFDEEVIWTSGSAPDLMRDEDYYFNQGLVIEEGAKIFLRGGARLIISDKLEIKGTRDRPVVFEGVQDSRNNFNISVSDADKVSIEYAVFQKGGYNQCSAFNKNNLFSKAFAFYLGDCLTNAALGIHNSQNINIYNSIFENNYKAINIIDSEDVSLKGNYFLHNYKMAIYSETEDLVELNNNCWMRPSGPKHENNPDGKGEIIVGDFNFNNPMQCGSDFKPVILIPGIGGSFNWAEMFFEADADDDWIFTPGVDVYDSWAESLEDLGYKKDRDYFIIYYDWRDDNKESLENYLLPKLKKIKKKSYDEKFDIIAHSMGGFMTMDYLTSDDYQEDIDRVVLQGSPLLGSNKVYQTWEGGIPPKDWGTMIERYLWFLARKSDSSDNYDAIHKYIPSAKQLMPLYNYLEKDGETVNFWEMEERNDYLMDLMQQISDNQDNFDFENNLLMIQGSGHDTSETIEVEDYEGEDSDKLWKDGIIVDEDFTEEGDGTVLNLSSGSIPLFETITLEDTDHGELPAKAVAKTGEFLGIPFNKDEDYSSKSIIERILMLFACPIDVKVVDSSGNYIDKDESQIEGAYYYSDGRDDGYKIIEIQNPEDEEYSIEIIGNGDGDYDAIVYNYSETGNTQVEFSGEVKKDEEILYDVNLNDDEISLEEIVVVNNNTEGGSDDNDEDDDEDEDDDGEDDEDDEEDESGAEGSNENVVLADSDYEENIFGNKVAVRNEVEKINEMEEGDNEIKVAGEAKNSKSFKRGIIISISLIMLIGLSLFTFWKIEVK